MSCVPIASPLLGFLSARLPGQVLSTCGWFCLACSSAWGQTNLSPVVVAEVVEEEILTGYRVVGTVRPLRTSTIGSAADGRVDQFLVDLGQPVQAGQEIAKLKVETLQIELDAAKAELRLVEQQLAELENGSRPEDIAEALAMANQAQAAMDNAASQLSRMTSLADRNAASEADVDDARERAIMTRFAYEALAATLERVKQGPRVEQIAQRQAQVDLQMQRIRLIEDRIQKHTLYAPFDGFVAEEFTEVGAWISSGDPVARIIQLDEIEIEVPVTADFVSKLKIGDNIRVELFEVPDRLLTGRLDRVVPLTETRSRTYPVFIRMRNVIEEGRPILMGGMLAQVDLPAGAKEVLPLVPKDALVLNGDQATVFVVNENEKVAGTGLVEAKRVELGVASGTLIQVKGDLRAGQKVVVLGNERLSTNQAVRFPLGTEVTAGGP